MGALIVEAVAAASPDAMRRQRDASRADLVELRLDLLDRPDADAALAGRRRPVIATCRAAWEGGRFQGSEAERLAILTRALALGADYVDLEWKAAAALEHWPAEARARVVLSSHDFEGVPADLADRVRDMRRHGTAVVKVAVTARALRDDAAGHRHRPGRTRRRPTHGRDRHGHAGPRDPRAARARRLVLDLRRQRRGARAGHGRSAARRVPGRPRRRVHAGLRGRRPAHRPFGVAGHAQRRLRRDSASTASTSRARRPTSTTSSRSPMRSASPAPA